MERRSWWLRHDERKKTRKIVRLQFSNAGGKTTVENWYKTDVCVCGDGGAFSTIQTQAKKNIPLVSLEWSTYHMIKLPLFSAFLSFFYFLMECNNIRTKTVQSTCPYQLYLAGKNRVFFFKLEKRNVYRKWETNKATRVLFVVVKRGKVEDNMWKRRDHDGGRIPSAFLTHLFFPHSFVEKFHFFYFCPSFSLQQSRRCFLRGLAEGVSKCVLVN